MQPSPRTCPIWHLRLTLAFQEPTMLPRMNKAITLRGAFGSSLRSLVCVDRNAECSSCGFHSNCVYGFVFSPSISEEADRLRLSRDIPRPFVIKSPSRDKDVYMPGDELEFELVLVGKARQLFPYVVVSFQRLGETGVGVKRGKFRVECIEALDARGRSHTVMEKGSSMVQVPSVEIALEDAPHWDPKTVQVEFLSPVLLKKENRWEKPYFGTLMRRLRDRINALSYFYCDQVMEMDYRGFGERADKVESVFEDLRWVQESRFSKHRDLNHTLKGWVGRATYSGALQEFFPLLWLGQFLHVGKAAAFGQGDYIIKEA